ncbi:MAG: ATP-binding cassette domain-containing protein [Deltaproteobacteria bacterium]|nr:ATP-binding cassette domain-containing protein [Deltaproteobacteria bacterium]
MINIEKLHFSYLTGDFHLYISKLNVEKGEKVAVIGPSGSGKTTLLNLIAGIIPVKNGDIRVGETRIDSLNDAQRRDFRELLDYLNVIDNILHPFRITRALTLDKDVRGRAVALAEKMGIGDKLKRQTNDLSHGEKQRNAICRALLPHPKLILADEATGNLDPENKDRILDLLFQAVDEGSLIFGIFKARRRFDRQPLHCLAIYPF